MRGSLALALCLLAFPANAAAQNVAVVHIESMGNETLPPIVSAELRRVGATVTDVTLSPGGGGLPSYDAFDQIWFLDFSASADNAPAQIAAYNGIAAWYAAHRPQAILDGRMISSLWTVGTQAPHGSPDVLFVENYLRVLAGTGLPGLVLATDDAGFSSSGITTLTNGMGFSPFSGSWYTDPYQASIDPRSPLWSYPHVASHACATCGAGGWLYDNSSTSIVPIGSQPNGALLYPVAWHGTIATNLPAISTTFALRPVTVAIDTPTAASSYVAFGHGPVALAGGARSGLMPYTFSWATSSGVALPTSASGTRASTTLASLSPSPQTITLRVTDAVGQVATATLVIYSGYCSDGTSCPTGRPCVDGLCCDTACGGGATDDCQACGVDAGGSLDGTCGPIRAGFAPIVCRASAGACDVTETCGATSTTCPADAAATDGTSCADATACNGAETCASGSCASGTPITCDDGDACTADGCTEPAGTCMHAPVAGCCNAPSDCDDGDACTSDACTSHACIHTNACFDAGTDAAVARDAAVTVDAAVTTDASAHDAGHDAAASDARVIDGAVAADAGGTVVSAGGCGCHAGGARSEGGLALLGLALVVAARRRRSLAGATR